MAGSVTIQGSGGGLGFTVTGNLVPFQALTEALSAAIGGGLLDPISYTGGSISPLTDGHQGELVIGPGSILPPSDNVTLPTGYNAVVDIASNPVTVNGNGGMGNPVTVLGVTGGLTFNSGVLAGYTSAGSGTVVASGGNNTVNIAPILSNQQGGDWVLRLGGGTNTYNVASGTTSIKGGYGTNTINLTGSDSDRMVLVGSDTVSVNFGGTSLAISQSGGAAVVTLGGAWHGYANFDGTFNTDQAGGATIYGGGGSVTAWGGAGTAYFVGGSVGNNHLHGAQGNTTLFGASDGDILRQNNHANVNGTTLMYAGAGNETLAGAGNDILSFSGKLYSESLVGSVGGTEMFGSTVAGATDNLFAGLGADTLVAGASTDNMYGTAYYGGDLYLFEKGITSINGGAHITISDFTVGKDTISLQGYGMGNMQDLQNASTVVAGSTVVTLSDHTTVTFLGVNSVTSANSHITFS